jgi:hypothetical protein
MTTQSKIIKKKMGILELAQHLGNVSQACKVMGYSRDSFTDSRNFMTRAANWPFRKSADGSRS